MAAQTLLDAVSSNSVGSWFDVSGDFSAVVTGIRPGEVVIIEIGVTATEADAAPCGIGSVFTTPDVRTCSLKGDWKVRAKPSGLSPGSAVTCKINQ